MDPCTISQHMNFSCTSLLFRFSINTNVPRIKWQYPSDNWHFTSYVWCLLIRENTFRYFRSCGCRWIGVTLSTWHFSLPHGIKDTFPWVDVRSTPNSYDFYSIIPFNWKTSRENRVWLGSFVSLLLETGVLCGEFTLWIINYLFIQCCASFATSHRIRIRKLNFGFNVSDILHCCLNYI